MSNKTKGSNAERELLKFFIENGFKAARVAGSGMNDESPCDLIVGKANKKFAIECKTCKSKKRYIDKKQIEDFLIFSESFGLTPLIAIRFNRQGWLFLKPEDLEKTGKGLAISLKNALENGKRFGQMFE
ncbi:MAG: Holliday junction resolvase Hjc [Candidatus Pacearchaeota archaeon]